MEYIFSLSEPHERFVSIELKIKGPFDRKGFELQLPSWRPGRYELGNFAKNVKDFLVADQDGKAMQFSKSSKDKWIITGLAESVTVSYKYYAAQPDAGACYVDNEMLYINPVHCCFFIPGRENEICRVKLEVPGNWKVATGMTKKEDHLLEAVNFEQLADCPFIASPSLSHAQYTLDKTCFNIWMQGDANPDWKVIIKDFEAFTDVQLGMMKEFPAGDYHFLVLLLPFPFYHGVEHLNSTVLALGPGYKLMQPAMYKELLGVASHELFHSWNIKNIRPVEMLPYNFTSENYAETGYVYEGVTTYYGDLFLARSGFFTFKSLLSEYSLRLQRHMDNPGRFNYSVSQSSFDTWLDGYTPGVPGRKTSIYDEGCLLALILDFMIRAATESIKSLDDVMRILYFDYAKNNRGYTKLDYKEIAEKVAGRNFDDYFNNYVYSAASLDSLLGEVISLAGLRLTVSPAANKEQWLGIKTEIKNNQTIVTAVYPGSPAANAGIIKDDELIAFKGIRIDNNLSDLVAMNAEPVVELLLSSGRKIRQVSLSITATKFFNRYCIEADDNCTQEQLIFRNHWTGSKQ